MSEYECLGVSGAVVVWCLWGLEALSGGGAVVYSGARGGYGCRCRS